MSENIIVTDNDQDIPESEIGEYELLNSQECDLGFERALALLKEGRCVMRLANMDDAQEKEIWFGRFLQLCTDIEVQEDDGSVVCDDAELIVIRDKDMEHFQPWSPRMDDIMAEDWCEVLRHASEVEKTGT